MTFLMSQKAAIRYTFGFAMHTSVSIRIQSLLTGVVNMVGHRVRPLATDHLLHTWGSWEHWEHVVTWFAADHFSWGGGGVATQHT